MTQETFNNILEDDDISFNDRVEITIINPYREWWEFWKPKTLSFRGVLYYTYDCKYVGILAYEMDGVDNRLLFDFEQVIGINKIEMV